MSDKTTHLQMIQAVITRMNSNSFMIKGWSISLVTAIVALSSVGKNPFFVFIAYIPSIPFWGLDAYYLRQERLFRKLHERVIRLDETEIDFSMNTAPFANQVASIPKVMGSITLALFHGFVFLAILVVLFGMIAFKGDATGT